MLALIVVRSSDADQADQTRVQSEMQKFGWNIHPLRPGVLTADFHRDASTDQVFSTAEADMGISLSVAASGNWSMEVHVVEHRHLSFRPANTRGHRLRK